MGVSIVYAHASCVVTHDGADLIARRYRYHCKCGAVGEWRGSANLARNDHAIHKHTADLP